MNYDIRKQLEDLQKHYFLAIDEAFKAKTVLGEANFEEMRQDLMSRYRIERDQLKEKAKIPDKNINFETNLKIYELTPHRCGFLWIFKNEARKLKEREVSAEDRIELDARTDDVEQLEEKVYDTPEPPEEEPQKKLSFLKRLFKKREIVEQLENTLQAADEAAPAEVFEQPEPPAAAPADVAPPLATSTAAPSTCTAVHYGDNVDKENTGNAAEPPAAAATSEAPKPRHRRQKPAETPEKPADVPAAPARPAPCIAPAPQLSGQIAMDELTNK